MSLDVYLYLPTHVDEKPIFIRRDGINVKITVEEWISLYPGLKPYVIEPDSDPCVFSQNITHNLNTMVNAVSEEFYKALWKPEEIPAELAADLIEPLGKGLQKLKENPEEYKKYNPANGWGDYEGLCEFTEAYLKACIAWPNAYIRVSR